MCATARSTAAVLQAGTGLAFDNLGDHMPTGNVSAYTAVFLLRFSSLPPAPACVPLWTVADSPVAGGLFVCGVLRAADARLAGVPRLADRQHH